MRYLSLGVVIGALGVVLAASTAVLAEERACCPSPYVDNCLPDPCSDESEDYIDVTWLPQGGSGDDSVDQYGAYPRTGYTTGLLRLGDNGYGLSDRLELRWQDLSRTDGRVWGRVALWPLTLEGDSAIISGRAWDSFGAAPALVSQRTYSDRLQLRLHQAGLDNWQSNYERFEINRTEPSLLADVQVARLSTNYNFTLGSNVRGQLRQTATAFDAPRVGATDGQIDTTQLKLDADMGSDVAAYGRLSYSSYKYPHLADTDFSAHDYTLGLRYRPSCAWEWDAELRSQDYPSSNTVSSHVENYSQFGVTARYASGCGNTFEAGYQRRNVDYAKLNMQNAAVFFLLRQPAVVTPAQVAGAVTMLSPQYDDVWVDLRTRLGDDTTFTTRVDYNVGDNPTSELTAAFSPGLYLDKRITRSHGLTWSVDDRNELGLQLYDEESKNTDRATSFGQHYLEGSWSTRVADDGNLLLAYRKTNADFGVAGAAGTFTTNDNTYLATFSQNEDDFNYALNLSVSDGTGAEVYKQVGAGASLKFKERYPFGVTLDWYDRNYTNLAAFNKEELTVGVNYRFDL